MMKEHKEQAMLWADELLDDLLRTPDAELIAEAKEDWGGTEACIGNIRAEIESAINSLGKDRLQEAKASVALDRPQSANYLSAIECRKRVNEFLSSDAGRARLTLAARNGRGLSEKDILSAFSDLCELEGTVENSAPRQVFGNAPKAERILQDLGITEPQEIDVEAIAWHLGVRIRYGSLEECDARIVGTDDSAIITVNKRCSLQRQRFSVCHELGHWIYHRRRMLLCQADEIERPSAGSLNMERIADKFASELLMPDYLFVPIAQSLGRPNMHVVKKLSEIFNTSQTATAIRLVEISQLPLVLVCHGRNGRRWVARSQTVSIAWAPMNELAPDSSAFTMIFGKAPRTMPPKSASASKWFGRHDASRFEVIEEFIQVPVQTVVTLLAFKNAPEFLRYSQLYNA